MREILEQLMQRHARLIHRDGVLCRTADGDELMARAFAALGWNDPQPVHAPAIETAAIEPSERAVMPTGRKKRV